MGAEDKFKSKAEKFFQTHAPIVKAMTSKIEKTLADYQNALIFFSSTKEFSAKNSPDFLRLFVDFSEKFVKALPQPPKKTNRVGFSRDFRKHKIGERIGQGEMADVISSIRKGRDAGKKGGRPLPELPK